jgi:hypothetical protein
MSDLPQAFQQINYADVVRVALYFEEYYTPGFTDEQIVGHIMQAFGGKVNPRRLAEEIKKQRGG